MGTAQTMAVVHRVPVCHYCLIKSVWILNVNHLVNARNSVVIKVADGKVIQNNQIYSEL